jgi:RND family efflux transporter MFP subunit
MSARTTRWWITGTLAAATLLAGCKGKEASAEDGADSTAAEGGEASRSSLRLPVVGAGVRKGDLVLSVATAGQVRSDAVSSLRFETDGTVQEVLVRPGQRVAKGQPLVRLDPRPFDMAVAEAEAAVEQAKVQYLDNIVPDSIVSGQPPSEERRRNARARSGLDGAEVRLQRARLDRERSTIVAPFAGTVDRVQVAAGERVRASQDAATVVDLSRLVVEAQVLEHDLPLVKVGGQARVTAAALGGRELTGRITALLPLVDSATRAGRALVEVRGDQVLRPGMYADVRLEATRLPGRVLVPSRAIIERDGRPLVFVVKEGKAQWTYILPGRTNGVDTEVLPDSTSQQVPVAVGDTVIIEGHLTLTHDAPVRLVAQQEREGE